MRHAIVVGANHGGGVLEPLRYAERDAESMGNLLLELGDFDESLVTVLYAPSPQRLRTALARHAALSELYDDDLFLFYYSGHADAQGLRLGQERYYFETLKHDVKTMQSDLRVGILDACRSGVITRLKGATVSASIFEEPSTTEGEAWLTASAADELAQESDILRGGFFSHYLLSGLRGAADTNDGVVDLEELYRYTSERVIAHTGRTAAGTQHPHFSRNLDGYGVVGLTDLRNANARIELPEGVAGEISVLRRPDNLQIAELSKTSDIAMFLALPPGPYLVRRRSNGKLYEMSVTLPEESRIRIESWGVARVEGGLTRGTDDRASELFDLSAAYEARLNLDGSPWVAGGASLAIPGAGQAYNGQVWKGVAYLSASTSLWTSIFSLGEFEDKGILTVAGLALWGAAVADATYNVHRREDRRPARGATLSGGAGYAGQTFPHHIGVSADVILGQGISIGLDRVGYTPYQDGWDLAAGSRFTLALREGRRWRPAGFMSLGYRHGRAPGDTTTVGRLVFGGGLNVRYYVVPRYFVELEGRYERDALEAGLGAAVMYGIHLGR